MNTNNIFETGAVVLVNPVNICGVMGAGLAQQFARQFPDMLRDYKAYCKEKGVMVSDSNNSTVLDLAEKEYRPQGWLHVWHGDGVTVINLATKIGWVRPSYLDLVQNGLSKLADWVNEYKPASVAIPALGCGCGGLSWNQVGPIITKTIQRFPTCTKVWVNGKWMQNTKEETIIASLSEIRRYIPFAKESDIARLGVPPQDYAAFGYERVTRNGEKKWVSAHIVIRDSSAASKNSSVWEIQARWLNADGKLSGEGAAYVVATTSAAAQIAFRDYVVNNCEKNPIAGDIFCRPFRGQELLMTGAIARCTRIEGDTTNAWFKKALYREQQLAADNAETNFKEEKTMKGTKINNDNNGNNFEGGNVSLDFFKPGCAKLEDDESQQTKTVVTAPAKEVVDAPQTTWANVDDYVVASAAFEVAVAAEIAAAANNKGDNDNGSNDTPPVNPSPATKVRKMPGVIAGLNVAAALSAGITMAEAARRMSEIRTLRAQLKGLSKPGVEVKVPTRPQRVRGHRLADAVASFEFFEDFYKVLVKEFEAKYGATTITADNTLPADENKVSEQKEISPVPDTVTTDEKPLPKPENPEDDPEDPQDPEEPSDGDNGDGGNEPANDNPPVFDGGDNNNDGTGASSDIAAASADQEVNDGSDFYNEESVPPTPEELYGDTLRACFKHNVDAQALETVFSMLHREHKLYVDLDDGDGIEIDDEGFEWVAAQLAQHIAIAESSYTGGGCYEEDDFSDALKAEQEAKTAAASSTAPVVDPEPEPEQPQSTLNSYYENLLLQYCKFPKYELNPDVLLPEQIAAEMSDYARIEREQLDTGVKMLVAFFGDDTVRAAAALDKAVNGYSDHDMTVKNRYQRQTYGKRCPLRKIFGFRQDKRGNFYVKGDRGKVRNDWMRANTINGVGFVFEAAPQGTHFFR